MSLPTDPSMTWPPRSEHTKDMSAWAAWYSGTETALSTDSAPANRKWWQFWRQGGMPIANEKTQSSGPRALHLPLAADIAQSSADLLFGDEVDLLLPDAAGKAAKAQARLEEIVTASGLHNTLLAGAETCAAMGGCYLRATWDTAALDVPFISIVQADDAVPEFAWGNLIAVTFWRECARDGSKVTRHLERHEAGYVLHGLYQGTATTLGTQVPLTRDPSTAELEPQVALPKGMTTDVWYVPNVLPNQRDRRLAQGRADIAGAETFLDALDETYSSLVRDIRIGKARLIVPSQSMQPGIRGGGRGSGQTFDLDAEVFTELDGFDPKEQGLFAAQFQIRTTDHLAAAVDLTEKVVSKAGYSPQTFGLRIEGRAESGTALRIREQKTYRTMARKRRYWAPGLRDAVGALLIIDREILGNRAIGAKTDTRPMLGWPEEERSTAELAQTAALLRQAEAASIETRVRMVSPDLSEEGLAAEVERIRSESGAIVPPPDGETGGAASR